MSHTALYSQMIGFVGRHWPSHTAQQHLQWYDMASRGRLLLQQPKGSCMLQFENQPQHCPLTLEDEIEWYWVVDTVNGENNRKAGPG